MAAAIAVAGVLAGGGKTFAHSFAGRTDFNWKRR
jgi:hypothetical protein